jgi:uncharacterized protein (TIGR00251 family)
VRVVPRASRDQIEGVREGALVVRLKAPPVDGEANAALVELLAGCFRRPRSAVTVVSGASRRRKRVKILKTNASVARRVLEAAVRPARESR